MPVHETLPAAGFQPETVAEIGHAAVSVCEPPGSESRECDHSLHTPLLDILPKERYRLALQLGCADGGLSARLAARCARLLAMDSAPAAVAAAAERHRALDNRALDNRVLDNVEFRCGRLPRDLAETERGFDLIVLADVGCSLRQTELTVLLWHLVERLAPSGDLIARHLAERGSDHQRSGDQTHAMFTAVLGRPLYRQRYPGFLLDVWRPRRRDAEPGTYAYRRENPV